MAKCDICDKKRMRGNKLSVFRSRISGRTKVDFKPNIKKIRINDKGTVKTINICTRCLRSGVITRAV